MSQSGVGSMQGSNEDCLPMKGHTRGRGRTHNVTQQTDTHIFNGGGRTHNITQRKDTQIFFDMSARIYASCARIFARIFMKILLVVKHYFINISFKFHKDLSFR